MKINRNIVLLATFLMFSVLLDLGTSQIYEERSYSFNVIQTDPCIKLDIIAQDHEHQTVTMELNPVVDPNVTCGSNYKTPMYFINNTPLNMDLLNDGGVVIENEIQYAPLEWYGIDSSKTGFVWFSGGSLNQLPKRFNVYMGSQTNGLLGTFYAGSTTYGVVIYDATYPYANTTYISYQWGSPAMAGKSLVNLFFTGQPSTQMTTERIFRQGSDAFKTTGYYEIIEGGSVRSVIRVWDSAGDSEQYYYVYKDLKTFYTRSIDHSDAWFIRGDKMNLLGSQDGAIGCIYGTAGDGDGTDINPLDESIKTVTLGWVEFYFDNKDYGYLWNWNTTSDQTYIANDGVQFSNYILYNSDAPAGIWFEGLFILADDSNELDGGDFQELYGNWYWADNITTVFETGDLQNCHYTATMLRYCNNSAGVVETNLTISRTNDPMDVEIDGKYIFQSQNFSSVENIYVYLNKSLYHHYAYNNTDWTYGASDPLYAGNSEIWYGGNETQFCTFNSTGNVDNRCNDTMTSVDKGFYFVSIFDANRSIEVFYNDTELASGGAPPTTTTTTTPSGNCSCVKNINVDVIPATSCLSNSTLFHNYTFRSSEGLDYVYSYEWCEYGCDPETNTCNPSSFMSNTYLILFVLGVVILVIVGTRWLNRVR